MSNPYEAPKSDATTNEVSDGPKKRPVWVWVISVLYGLSAIWTPISFYLIYAGLVPLNAAQKAYFDGLGVIDWAVTVAVSLIMLAAVVALFLLRRVSVKLWGMAVVFSVLSYLYNAMAKNWLAALDVASIIGAAVGFALVVAIFFYTKRLDARGFLK
jgi:mannose/fructose/N-acetylgalactosamine-specific phosphotransferase system component IIC